MPKGRARGLQVRSPEHPVIQEIERLGPELEVSTLVDVELLEDGEVQIVLCTLSSIFTTPPIFPVWLIGNDGLEAWQIILPGLLLQAGGRGLVAQVAQLRD